LKFFKIEKILEGENEELFNAKRVSFLQDKRVVGSWR
jgi:hypothetical protein